MSSQEGYSTPSPRPSRRIPQEEHIIIHQRRSIMRRISPNNPVRRRLFVDPDQPREPFDQARVDNLANVIQESVVRDRMEKMQKWNFDFENDEPLEGKYEWHPSDGKNDWIGVKSDTKLEKDSLQIKVENEVTPKGSKEGELAPMVRKRRSEGGVNDNVARRRISFD